MDKPHKLNIRAGVSIALLVLLIVLFLTAVGIQILDMVIDPEILIAIYREPEKQTAPFLVELQHIITAIHVIAGFSFCGIAMIHIVKNGKALKSYFRKS